VSARAETWLWLAHRLSGALLALLVTLHLATIIYAVQDGVSAAEILGRTRGSIVWGSVYGVFVLAASMHAGIGIRGVLRETVAWRSGAASAAALFFGLALLVLGLRAVAGVVL
jgi:succinate dehydrogenase subunit C